MDIKHVDDAPLVCTRARGSGTVVFEATALRVRKLLRIRAAAGREPYAPLDDFLKETPGLTALGTVGCVVELRSSASDETVLATRARPSEVAIVWLGNSRSLMSSAASAILEHCAGSAAASPLLTAVEDTDGTVAFRLSGPDVTSVLCRLADVSGLPRFEGHATRLRLAELHASLVRRRDDYIVMVGAPYQDFLVEWLRYASERMS